jgi:amino acid adenylation domain-containing protein
MPIALQLHGKLHKSVLRRALDRIVARHEGLRTTFITVEGVPQQRIAPVEDGGFYLLEHDLRQHHNPQRQLERLIAEEAEESFDLQAGPLIRGRLIQMAEEEHALLITMHHIVSDGWSIGVLFNELSLLYGAFVCGDEDPLPELAVQYADYAVWQRKWMEGEILKQQVEYWKKNLEGAPQLLELPTDRVRPARQDHAAAMAELVLGEKLTVGLKQLGRKCGTTLYMTLLTGWAVLLGRLSGQHDVVIGTPVANRGRVEIENLIGFFVNALALRIDLSGRPTVQAVLERVKKQVVAAQQHQDIPFERVVEIVRPERNQAYGPIFQAVFSWQNTGQEKLEMSGLEVQPLQKQSQVLAKSDLTLYVEEAEQTIVGEVEFVTCLYDNSTMMRYLGHLRRLLEGMVAGEQEIVDCLSLISEEERNQLLYTWNNTAVAFSSDKCVLELFDAQVKRSPEAIAVEYDDQRCSYRELSERANQLARHLRDIGVSPDVRVGLCVERSFEMIVGILGILKAGGAYVPLDPEYPLERLDYMLQDSEVPVVLSQSHLAGKLPSGWAQTVCLDSEWAQVEERSRENLDMEVDGKNAAYLIYTSGSTGRPKGVLNTHEGLRNLAAEQQRIFQLGAGRGVLQFASLSFDAATSEWATALTSGSRLIVAKRERLLDGEELARLIEEHRIEVVTLPPSLLGVLPDVKLPNLSTLVVAGEACSQEQVSQWTKGRQMLNAYGPSETTVCATVSEPMESGREKDIGKPIGNMQVYVVDENFEPLPVGIKGELLIGGTGLARGYVGLAELTAEKFLPNPFSPTGGERLYRTGDMARWGKYGTLEFLGRSDHQVKIRGNRIELEEIEARLREHPKVEESAVLVREDQPGEKRLVAYYTIRKGQGEQQEGKQNGQDPEKTEQLWAYLTSRVPAYMVPAVYVRLESFPLTANLKLDRNALPAPEANTHVARQYEAPEGEVEEALAGIWAAVLKVEKVGRNDNFFSMGGHSLLAVEIVGRIRERLDIDIQLKEIFESNTVKKMAVILNSLMDMNELLNHEPTANSEERYL